MVTVSMISLAALNIALAIIAFITQFNLNRVIKSNHCGAFFGVRNLTIYAVSTFFAARVLASTLLVGHWSDRASFVYHFFQFCAFYSITDYCVRSFTDSKRAMKLYSLFFPIMSMFGAFFLFACMDVDAAHLDKSCFSVSQFVSLFVGGSGRFRSCYRSMAALYMLFLTIPVVYGCMRKFQVIFKEAFSVIILTTISAIFYSSVYISPSWSSSIVETLVYFLVLQGVTMLYVNNKIILPRITIIKKGTLESLTQEAKHDY